MSMPNDYVLQTHADVNVCLGKRSYSFKEFYFFQHNHYKMTKRFIQPKFIQKLQSYTTNSAVLSSPKIAVIHLL